MSACETGRAILRSNPRTFHNQARHAALLAVACCITACGQPPLRFATYLGGSRDDEAHALAVDDLGYVYVTGSTESVDFPLAPATARKPLGGGRDAFVAKFAPDGKTLIFSVYLGGSLPDSGNAIAVDAAGNVYVAGETQSPDFPVTRGAFQTTPGGAQFSRDAFVVKLSPTGDLLYSTYLGGNYDEAATGIAVDDAGNAYVTGWTWSATFPTVNAIRSRWDGEICVLSVSPSSGFPMSMHPCEDAFVAKLNPAGSALLFSTYLGGKNQDLGEAIALDAQGNVWVTGSTRSEDFALVQPFQGRPGGGTCNLPTSFPSTWSRYTCEDAFVVKLAPQGDALLFSTWLGGDRADFGRGLAVDAAGNPVVAGETASAGFPVTNGAFQTAPGGGADAFITKLNTTGSALVFSTLLGGAGEDRALGLALDPAGNVYAAGTTVSPLFPLTPGSPETASGRGFVAKLDAAGARLIFSGRLRATLAAVAVDSLGTAYVTGAAASDFVTTPGAFQPTHAGGTDAVVARLDLFTEPQIAPNGAVNAASYLFGPVAPGEIVAIFGAGIGPRRAAALRLNAAGLVDTGLTGTRVLFDGIPAPLIYAQANQTSVVAPYGITDRAAVQIEVEHRGMKTAPLRVAVADAAPGIFALDAAGKGQGAILNQDYSVNSAANPALRGSVVMVFATGEGQTDPPGVDGKPAAAPLPKPGLPVEVKIGGLDAAVLYAGGAPGMVAGLVQVNVRIPEGAAPGPSVPVVLVVGSASSQQGLTVAVR
jgi:uncharacterized protein (TIGR03437 family)